MKIKKITAILLSTMMMAGTLSGCGGGESKPKEPNKETYEIVETGLADMDDISFIEKDADAVIEGTDAKDTVIYDKDGFKAKLISINPGEAGSNPLDTFTTCWQFENNTDAIKTVKPRFALINGCPVRSPGFYCQIESGQTSEEAEITGFALGNGYPNEMLFRDGKHPFGEITSITYYLDVDEDSWSSDDDILITVTIYPQGKEKAKAHRREIVQSDVLVYSDKYVDIYSVHSFYYSDSYVSTMYAVNKSDTEIGIWVNPDNYGIELVNGNPSGKARTFMYNAIPGQAVYFTREWITNDMIAGEKPDDKFDITAAFLIQDMKYEKEEEKKEKFLAVTDNITFPWVNNSLQAN